MLIQKPQMIITQWNIITAKNVNDIQGFRN